jgi:hypothetical protein
LDLSRLGWIGVTLSCHGVDWGCWGVGWLGWCGVLVVPGEAVLTV